MKNIYTIYVKTTTMNNLHYANANRFVRSYSVDGEQAMLEKIQELRKAGVEIKSVYNRIGRKVDI